MAQFASSFLFLFVLHMHLNIKTNCCLGLDAISTNADRNWLSNKLSFLLFILGFSLAIFAEFSVPRVIFLELSPKWHKLLPISVVLCHYIVKFGVFANFFVITWQLQISLTWNMLLPLGESDGFLKLLQHLKHLPCKITMSSMTYSWRCCCWCQNVLFFIAERTNRFFVTLHMLK